MRARNLTARAGRQIAAVRTALLGAAVAIATAVATMPAFAQSYVCNDLAAKLAALQKRPASPADRWADAIVEQRRAIEQNRASQVRCGDPADPRCAAIVERGRQMTSNLAVLERQHAQLGGTRSGATAEEGRIRTLMAQMRCGESRPSGPVTATFDGSRSRVTINGATPGQPPVTYRVAAPGEASSNVVTAPRREPRGFFDLLFGGGSETTDAPPPPEEQVIDPATAQMLTGSYRTLCVRTCDGYFFPISFNATRGRLKTDANVCKALCPATETRLYYHSNPGQEAEQAVAADGGGEPLTRLPNAFRYRTEVVQGCTCGKPDPRLLPPGAGGLRGLRDAAAETSLPMPARRPDPDADPETQAVMVGGLTVEPVTPRSADEATANAGETTEIPDPPKVRIVGPKYFSDR